MRYYRCKCGHRRMWGSMPPNRCTRCTQCGSNLAEGPSEHRDPEPHQKVVEHLKTDNGPQPISLCKICYRPWDELIKRGEVAE